MAVPLGFVLNARTSPATRMWEPIYARSADLVVELGLVVGDAHLNTRGILHGGVIATLADNAMGLSLAAALGGAATGILTTTLAVDYVGVTKVGQWLQVTPRVVKAGKTSGVVDALITADAVVVARANAAFRVLT